MNVYKVSVMQSSYLLDRVVVANDALSAINLVLAAVPDSELVDFSKKYEDVMLG